MMAKLFCPPHGMARFFEAFGCPGAWNRTNPCRNCRLAWIPHR